MIALLGGSCVALVDTAAESLLLLRGADGRLGLFGRDGIDRDGTTAGGFRTVAVVDFGLEGCSVFLDDSETAFDGVIGGTCRVVNIVKKRMKV